MIGLYGVSRLRRVFAHRVCGRWVELEEDGADALV